MLSRSSHYSLGVEISRRVDDVFPHRCRPAAESIAHHPAITTGRSINMFSFNMRRVFGTVVDGMPRVGCKCPVFSPVRRPQPGLRQLSMLHTTTPSDPKGHSNSVAAESEFQVTAHKWLREKDTVISALNELIDAQQQLLDSLQQLADSQQQLADSQQQLAASQQKLLLKELQDARMVALQYQGTQHMRGMLGALTGSVTCICRQVSTHSCLAEWVETRLEVRYMREVADLRNRYDALVEAQKSEQATAKPATTGKVAATAEPATTGKAATKVGRSQFFAHLCLSLLPLQIKPNKSTGRSLLWQVAINNDLELAACITERTGWHTADIPFKMDGIYTSLSNTVHHDESPDQYQQSINKVDLVVGPLAHKECGALACVAEAYNFPYRMVVPTSLPYADDNHG
jgi:hypothetical protein